jgi:hypothetical protein
MRSSRVWMKSSRGWMRSSREWMRSSRGWMRPSRLWMRSNRMVDDIEPSLWMRSSGMFRTPDSQCWSYNCPGFDTSILRHSGIWEVANEAVLNKVLKKSTKKSFRDAFSSPFLYKLELFSQHNMMNFYWLKWNKKCVDNPPLPYWCLIFLYLIFLWLLCARKKQYYTYVGYLLSNCWWSSKSHYVSFVFTKQSSSITGLHVL